MFTKKLQIRQCKNPQHICNPVQIKCIWKMFLHVFAKELQLKIYSCTQLQNDCIFEWFELKMLLIKVVVLMVKNQTTLSSFQFYFFFEMNNEKKMIISPTISNFQLSASTVIRTSVVPLSLCAAPRPIALSRYLTRNSKIW